LTQNIEALGLRVRKWIVPRLPVLSRVGRFGFLSLLLGVIAYQVLRDWQKIRDYPWRLNWANILEAFFLYTISLALTALVWALIMRGLSGTGSLFTHLRLYCLSNPARRLPTPVWYIGVRAVAYQELEVPRTITVTASIIEMVVTNLGALTTALVTLSFGLFAQKLPRIGWALVVLFPLAVLMLKPALLIDLVNLGLRKLKRTKIVAQIRRVDMLRWVGIFVLIFLNGGVLLYIAVSTIYPLPPRMLPAMINAFSISWLASWLGQMLFFLPNTAIRQVTLAYLLSFYMPWPVAIASTLLLRIAVIMFEMFWALIFARLKP